jgi:hypothetical protein
MPRVGFQPTIPVFERTKTVNVLDRVATSSQHSYNNKILILSSLPKPEQKGICYSASFGKEEFHYMKSKNDFKRVTS